MSDKQSNRDNRDVADAAPMVASTVEEALDLGYYGTKVDPTPNENYSLAGVVDGRPTPETDADHAEAVRRHQRRYGIV